MKTKLFLDLSLIILLLGCSFFSKPGLSVRKNG